MTQRGTLIKQMYTLTDTLGEGTFGKVKIGVSTDEQVAVKIIDVSKTDRHEVRREICLQKQMKHPNIISYLGFDSMGSWVYILLELVTGGELFDKIEPDEGLPQQIAHCYFRQVIAATEYLHTQGVAHRDIKPENLLLDGRGNLKLTDFGLATVFRHQGQERNLTRKCGTPPYVCPEVFKGNYKGPDADLWSCGIVLVTLLAGYLPWNEPTMRCREYIKWARKSHDIAPWDKLIKTALLPFGLLKKMLNPRVANRPNLAAIKANAWFRTETSLSKKMKNGLFLVDPFNASASAEPEPAVPDTPCLKRLKSQPDLIGFSSTQLSPSLRHITDVVDVSSPSEEATFTINRCTRVKCRLPCDQMLQRIGDAADAVGLSEQYTLQKSKFKVKFSTKDRRGNQLHFNAFVQKFGENCCIDFVRGSGDGIEFKYLYKQLFGELSDVQL